MVLRKQFRKVLTVDISKYLLYTRHFTLYVRPSLRYAIIPIRSIATLKEMTLKEITRLRSLCEKWQTWGSTPGLLVCRTTLSPTTPSDSQDLSLIEIS